MFYLINSVILDDRKISHRVATVREEEAEQGKAEVTGSSGEVEMDGAGRKERISDLARPPDPSHSAIANHQLSRPCMMPALSGVAEAEYRARLKGSGQVW